MTAALSWVTFVDGAHLIPDPPSPLIVLAHLDRLEVVVPAGTAWRRGVAASIAALALLWLGGAVGLGLLIGSAVFSTVALWSAWLGLLGLGLFTLGPTVVILGVLAALLRTRSASLRLGASGVDLGGAHVPWELVRSVELDTRSVVLELWDGTQHALAKDLPPAACWWLTATVQSLNERARDQPIDEDGLAAVRAAFPERPRDQSAWKPILPWVPSQ